MLSLMNSTSPKRAKPHSNHISPTASPTPSHGNVHFLLRSNTDWLMADPKRTRHSNQSENTYRSAGFWKKWNIQRYQVLHQLTPVAWLYRTEDKDSWDCICIERNYKQFTWIQTASSCSTQETCTDLGMDNGGYSSSGYGIYPVYQKRIPSDWLQSC